MTAEQGQALVEAYADLQVQAMIFDMGIDVETMSLVPKSDYKEPFWLTNWKERQHGADFDTQFDIDR